MKKRMIAKLAVLLVAWAGEAAAADLPVAPTAAPFAARFNWTSCYGGMHLGGAFGRKDITDPVQLVQDSFIAPGATPGITTVSPNPTGAVIGGQIGCDYQFASSLVIGLEGAVSGSTMRGRRQVGLPLGNPDVALVQANVDFLPSVTARIGYAFDNVLLYARGGVALAGDKFQVSGSFAGAPFDFRGLDNRLGWTVGGGVDWAFSQHWSAFVEYDYYRFGHANIMMADGINGFAGIVNVRQDLQVVKAGVNFHVWGAGM